MIDVKRAETEKKPISEINNFTTHELVEELKTREGVEAHILKSYEELTVSADGPAIVFVVID